MSLASTLFGWLVAGRVLRPLRTITELTRDISATDLHRRLGLSGPDDEVTRLGGTVDGLLERLEAAFTAQRHFVANASHELRTPITVARALLQMTLSDREATLETFRTTCEDVVKEGQQQERLIEALLVLARSERGLDHSGELDLSVVTADVLRSRQTEAARRGMLLRCVLEPALGDGDAHLAERLVTNLVDNALRHSGPDGTVDISTARVEGRVLLTVTNTGPVIPPADVPRLLQPFQRIGADSTDHSDGLGLGLSIVQAVADAHGAALRCRARDHGGLHVEVDFPARVADPPQRSRSAVTKPGSRLRRPVRSGDGRRVDPPVPVGDV
jgi:signal transduction histidine kinase